MADDGQDSGSPDNPTIVSLDVDTDGQPRPDLWRHGADDFSKLQLAATGIWEQIGPAPLMETDPTQTQWMGSGALSGELTGIAIDPSGVTDQVFLIATGDGGIWRSLDGGDTWTAVTDSLPSLSAGAVALDPANPLNVYAGTGNPVEGTFDNIYDSPRGIGIYKSLDRGTSWFMADGGPFSSCMAGFAVTKIIVPQADVVLVGTNHGLFRSVDGGLNFGTIAPTFNDGKAIPFDGKTDFPISDLAVDSRTPTTVYACVSGKGVYVSTDSGATFPSASNLFSKPKAPSSYTDISFAERNGTIFVSVAGKGTFVGLYLLVAGTQWIECPDSKRAENIEAVATTQDQSDYDLTIGIDPQDASNQRGFLGFQRLWVAQNPGGPVAFGPAPCTGLPDNPASPSNPPDPSGLRHSQVHADHHAIIFSPSTHPPVANTPRIYVGTDGGIFASPDGLKWSSLNGNIATALLYSFDIGRGSADNNGFNYSAMQDNSLACSKLGGGGPETWGLIWSGDGFCIAVDPTNPSWAYGVVNTFFLRTSNNGALFDTNASKPPVVGKNLPTAAGTRRIVLDQTGADPTNRLVYVSVSDQLFQSKDSGATFTALKTFSSAITALALAPTDSKRIWVGLGDGTVHMSSDGGGSWDAGSFTKSAGGSGYVAAIAVDPANIDTVAVAYAMFTEINPAYRTGHLFQTQDNGNSWKDIGGTDGNAGTNLPDLPIQSIVIDKSTNPSTIIVGTGCGVARSLDNGATWQRLGVGLPSVRCSTLAFDSGTGILRVGTYGRSCFELQKQTGKPFCVAATQLSFGPLQFPGLTLSLKYTVYNLGDAPFDVTGFVQILGDPHISLNPAFTANVTVAAGTSHDFSLQFQPDKADTFSATFQITTTDPANSNVTLFVTGLGVAAGTPRLAANANLRFGTVTKSNSRTLVALLSNSGSADLSITSITNPENAAFKLTGLPALPLTLHPGDSSQFSCVYTPASHGDDTSNIVISSTDPRSPVTIPLTGSPAGFTNWVLIIVLVAVGVAVAGGGALAIYEAEKK